MNAATQFFESEAISKPFLVTYQDGHKEHVDRATRDALLASLAIREVGHRRYKFIAKPVVLRTFADLSRLSFGQTANVRRFLQGEFVFELRRQKTHERLETPEGMTIRLVQQGAV